MRQENEKYRASLKEQVEEIKKKHVPVSLEADILRSAQAGIAKAIQDSLAGYNSPLLELVKNVVASNNGELRQIISDSFKLVIGKEEFKKSIVDAFSHKVARTIISNNDGLFDKVSNELRQDSVFKSRMAIAVSNVVEECLNERREKK